MKSIKFFPYSYSLPQVIEQSLFLFKSCAIKWLPPHVAPGDAVGRGEDVARGDQRPSADVEPPGWTAAAAAAAAAASEPAHEGRW